MSSTENRTLLIPANDALPIARQLWGSERLQVLMDVMAKGCTPAEVEAFALVCQRTRLDPFARPPQIYAIKRWDSKLRREVLQPQAAIDSFRLVAARTREYQGQLGPQWCGPDGVWKDVWLAKEHPAAARVGVLRKGFKEPIWSVAVWERAAQSFNGKLGDFWERMGPEMLAKTAECNALKRAFPNDTEGLELAAIEAELREHQAENAARYGLVFGADEDTSAYELPPQRALNGSGAVVDTSTGEVLEEHAKGGTPIDEPENVAAPQGLTAVPPGTAGAQDRSALLQENRRLVDKAFELGLTGVKVLNTRSERDVMAAANRELAQRIAAREAELFTQEEAPF